MLPLGASFLFVLRRLRGGHTYCCGPPQPQLQPALLRLSAMISHYFFTAAICPMRRAVRLWLVFPVPADVRDMSKSHDHPAAVFACRRFAPVHCSQAPAGVTSGRDGDGELGRGYATVEVLAFTGQHV